MMANGRKACNMDKELTPGKAEPNMQDSGKKEKDMVKLKYFLNLGNPIKLNLKMIFKKVKINYLMTRSLKN